LLLQKLISTDILGYRNSVDDLMLRAVTLNVYRKHIRKLALNSRVELAAMLASGAVTGAVMIKR
jgi:hypothetical protein